MSEKVKLPKELCDVFDMVLKCEIPTLPSDLFLEIATGAGTPKMYLAIKNIGNETIMRALVLGYEPEIPQPERELKELVQNTFNGEKDLYDMGYRYGAWDALRIHGIKYDWLEGDA